MATEEVTQIQVRERTNWEVYERLKQLGMFTEETHRLSGAPKLGVPVPMPGQEVAFQLHVEESKGRHQDIKQEAENNMRHYNGKAGRNGKPWFHFPKKPGIYSEYILVTPEMATVALEYNNNPRKRIKVRTVEAYSRDMKANRWIPTSESLDIDYTGYFYNGQHRFNAVIAAGVPVIFYVTFNTLVEARFGVDQGVMRSATEKLDLVVENHIGTKLAAICRAMMRGISNTGMKFTDAEICQFASKHGGIAEYIAKLCPGVRADVQAVFAKAAMWYGLETIEPFVKRVADVMFNSKNDPARRLYEFLIQGKKAGGGNSSTTYRKALGAIQHHIEGKEVRALFERERDIFEWGANWSVPEKTAENVL